jgi:hypothetical protein
VKSDESTGICEANLPQLQGRPPGRRGADHLQERPPQAAAGLSARQAGRIDLWLEQA